MQKARGQLKFEIFSLKQLLLHLASSFFDEFDSMELKETRLLIGGKRTLNWRYLPHGVVEWLNDSNTMIHIAHKWQNSMMCITNFPYRFLLNLFVHIFL
ncbi:hypothetical protein ES332_D07G234600v1 [Gossypium tomentosum]|uniref:Uncharacterized protein n=1 Tax=Gossypium tomentosum TaxID=34277 RepID=A0A5D2KAK8_GOSTO|nr:hypothetical protein ES332_D07G234600v1 [Gossypium tomentosum]